MKRKNYIVISTKFPAQVIVLRVMSNEGDVQQHFHTTRYSVSPPYVWRSAKISATSQVSLDADRDCCDRDEADGDAAIVLFRDCVFVAFMRHVLCHILVTYVLLGGCVAELAVALECVRSVASSRCRLPCPIGAEFLQLPTHN